MQVQGCENNGRLGFRWVDGWEFGYGLYVPTGPTGGGAQKKKKLEKMNSTT